MQWVFSLALFGYHFLHVGSVLLVVEGLFHSGEFVVLSVSTRWDCRGGVHPQARITPLEFQGVLAGHCCPTVEKKFV